MPELALGLLAGLLIGATGVGSGSLLTPLLILSGYRPAVAVSTGLATLIVSKLTGSIAHRSQGNWPGRQGWLVIAGGAIGVGVVASLAVAGVSPSDLFIRRAVAVSLVGAAVAVWLPARAQGEESRPPADPRVLLVSGAVVGGFVTLTSAGSGSLLVPVLLAVTAWGVPQLAATSNVFGSVAALLAFGLHLGQRAFDPTLFLLVLAGLVPGVVAGVFLSPRINRRLFVPLLSLFTLYLAIRLF